MSQILGIDAGGTTTNAVIYDRAADDIIWKSQAFTTNEALSLGILKSLFSLPKNIKPKIEEVHLSTTLATNYILENDFSNIGLIIIGDMIGRPFPFKNLYQLKCSEVGNGKLPAAAQADMIDHSLISDFEHIIVASLGSPDPELENDVCRVLNAKGFPAITATSICTSMDWHIRISTAVFNTGLIPLMQDLIESMYSVLSDLDINAPLKIMCGDGKLAHPDTVMRFPIFTIMSGPAASVAGGLFLCNEDDFLLIDMGGTSADITRIIDRRIQRKGISTIRDNSIQAESLNIKSFPAGGDSQIYYSHLGQLTVGPEKAIPLCLAGSRWPHLEEELRSYHRPKGYEMFTVNDTDCFCSCSTRSLSALNQADRNLVEEIRKKPHSLFYLSEKFGKDADSLHLDRLINLGYIQKISFTPTDILHILGQYTEWDRSISHTAANIMSKVGDMSMQKFLSIAEARITDQLAFYCMQSISDFENHKFDFRDSRATQYIIDHFLNKIDPYLLVIFKITKPIVAVGAPARCWLPKVATKLGTEIIIPHHFESANAVGVAVSNSMAEHPDVITEKILEKNL